MQISALTSAPIPSFAPAAIAAPLPSAPVPGGPVPVVPPLFNFPGVAKGDLFDIAKGSKVGMFSPKGTASVDLFDASAAAFHIKAGAFGVNVDMLVAVQRLSDTQVKLTTTSADGKATTSVGDIVAARLNYAEFVSTDGKKEHTVIQADGKGAITLDAVVPTFGNAHLVLQKHV
ncbi:MAG: hypothetical protein JWN72_2292 [Thermoleophilia bacterium]|nr:hypothetical protein [Thermoleophilia bacterium]